MEGINQIVSESFARYGFDRPLDYRRLRWSRWFRCESHHSLLVVPSRPGVFALAEEIMDFASTQDHVGTTAIGCPAAEAKDGQQADSVRRMLAVTQFFETDDMAFVLDRMLSRQNPMAARLLSGRYFVRFVVIEDPAQRRNICTALNHWVANSGEKPSPIGAHFAASPNVGVGQTLVSASAGSPDAHVGRTLLSAESRVLAGDSPAKDRPASAPQLESGAASNIHCPCPFPSGF